MKLKGQYSIFTSRPPGVLKSSVSTSPKPRIAPIQAFDRQQTLRIAQGIDPKNPHPMGLLTEIPPGMLFFCAFDNAYFIVKDGMDGVIITEDQHVLEETLYFRDGKINQDDIPPIENVQKLDDEVFISFDPDWMKYDHWMGYTMSRAFIANLYTPKTVPIIIPEYRDQKASPTLLSKALYNETLEKTGVKPRIKQLKDGLYQAKKVYLLWPNSYNPLHYYNFRDAGSVYQAIRERKKYREDLPTRFFIEQDSSMEKILDDKQLEMIKQVLTELNISSVNLQSMDWDTQLSLFSQAELIISPHRSELINILSCQQDAGILEFTKANKSLNYLPAWPYMIASTNHVQYSFFDIDWVDLTPVLIKDAINRLDAI